MDSRRAKFIGYCIGLGIMASAVGVDRCATGYIYSVAAKHEATAIGHITRVSYGKGSSTYHYLFSVNGTNVDDFSEVCSTPLTPHACLNNGQVLVYFSYVPFANSRLEDFRPASIHTYMIGVPALTFGLLLIVLPLVSARLRTDHSEHDSGSGMMSEQ